MSPYMFIGGDIHSLGSSCFTMSILTQICCRALVAIISIESLIFYTGRYFCTDYPRSSYPHRSSMWFLPLEYNCLPYLPLYQIHAVYDCNRRLLVLMVALLVVEVVSTLLLIVLNFPEWECTLFLTVLIPHRFLIAVKASTNGVPNQPTATSIVYLLDPSTRLRNISHVSHVEQRLADIQEPNRFQVVTSDR
jgi:hypothetical protein